MAAKFLQSQGLKILTRNLRTKIGEIDILASDGPTMVVVEVKTKTSAIFGAAIEMITPTKQLKLINLARWAQVKHQRRSVRIDIVTVDRADDSFERPFEEKKNKLAVLASRFYPRHHAKQGMIGEWLINHYKGVVEYHGN